MTAPTEPLKVTLEEGLKLLAERRDGRRISYEVDTPDGKPCWVAWQGWTVLGPADSLEDALEIALEQPVVARDEAAELRAEIERLRADLFEYVLDGFVQGAHRQDDGGYHTGGISTYRDLGNWLVEHAHWTRRPGGRGRNQVYDPPKADAASEGQP